MIKPLIVQSGDLQTKGSMCYPTNGPDARKVIQQALDQASKNGGGVVCLDAGTWFLHGSLVVPSEVVLRGRKDAKGKVATTLIITTPGDKDNDAMIVVQGDGGMRQMQDTAVKIANKYVPSGSTTFKIEDASGFSKGDFVCVQKTVNDVWVVAIGCGERLRHIRGGKEGSGKRPWKADAYQMKHVRQIVEIKGKGMIDTYWLMGRA